MSEEKEAEMKYNIEAKMRHAKADEPSTIAIEVSLGVKEVIVGWILLLVAYFALSLESYNWDTLLLQTAIVVGAGMIILVIYENASGNVMDLSNLSTVNWKGFIKTIVRLIIVIVSLVIGILLLGIGFLWIYDMFPYFEVKLVLVLTVIGFGGALLGLAYQQLKKMFGENDEEVIKSD